MPAIERLTLPTEQSPHVRGSLAGSVLGLTPIFGPNLTVDYLIQTFLHLIRDESPDVRLRIIGTLSDLSTVVGIDVLSQSLLPSIKELGKDRQWRVRLAVLDCMPALSKYLGEATFTEQLSGQFTTWIIDPVYSVRDAAAMNLRKTVEALGIVWAEVNTMPQLNELVGHKNYLYRISALLCVGTLAEVVGAPFLDKHLVPLVVKMSGDPVPNVRLNVAKTIQAMHPTCVAVSPRALENHLLPCLWRLLVDEDSDVKFFAKRAMTEIGVKT